MFFLSFSRFLRSLSEAENPGVESDLLRGISNHPKARRYSFVLALVFVLALSGRSDATEKPNTPVISSLPMTFEPNAGQAPLRYRFLARRNGMQSLYFTDGMDLFIPQPRKKMTRLRVRWNGINPEMSLTGEGVLPGRSNYLLGNDPSRWLRGIPQFARLRYAKIYK